MSRPRSKLIPFLGWTYLNLVLPLAPIGIKLFINYFGPNGTLGFFAIWETSDLIIYSLMINIINLNTNADGSKTVFEKLSRTIFNIFIALNCVLLAFVHLKIHVNNMSLFFVLSIGFPVIAGMFFKFKYQNQDAANVG